jgi:hypothetical protein
MATGNIIQLSYTFASTEPNIFIHPITRKDAPVHTQGSLEIVWQTKQFRLDIFDSSFLCQKNCF